MLLLDDTALEILEENLILNIQNNINGDIISKQKVDNANDMSISLELEVETLENIGIKQKR